MLEMTTVQRADLVAARVHYSVVSTAGCLPAETPQCTSIKGLLVSIRWYLGVLKGSLRMLAWTPKACSLLGSFWRCWAILLGACGPGEDVRAIV